MKRKRKKYIISIGEPEPNEDELEIMAKTPKEAIRKAKQILKRGEYFGMDILSISEERKRKTDDGKIEYYYEDINIKI